MRIVLAAVLCSSLALVACRSTPSPPPVVGDLHPVAQAARDALGPDGGPFGLLVTFTVRDDAHAAFEQRFAPAIEATRREPGNRTYELNRVAGTSDYVLYEQWRSVADLDWHLKSAPIVTLLDGIDAMAEIDLQVLVAP